MNRRGLLGLLAAWFVTPWRLLASQPKVAAKRRVVIFIPGTMGSTLQVNGKDVWGKDANTIYNTLLNNPAQLMFSGKPYSAPEVIDTLRLPQLPPWFGRDMYARLIQRLRRNKSFAGEVVLFSYDWRQDVRASVNDLKKRLETILKTTADTQGRALRQDGLAVDFIGHSQGGIIAFLAVARQVVHPENVRTLVLLGAPMRGSAKAFTTLFHEVDMPFLPDAMHMIHRKNYQKAMEGLFSVVRTFTSLYQMLPPRANGYLKENGASQLTNPLAGKSLDPQAAKAANDLHAELEAAAKAFPISKEQVRILSGNSLLTPTIVEVTTNQGIFTKVQPHSSEAGDGTVTELSAHNDDFKPDIALINSFVLARHDALGDDWRVLDTLDGILEGP